jgi:hypothetical protein
VPVDEVSVDELPLYQNYCWRSMRWFVHYKSIFSPLATWPNGIVSEIRAFRAVGRGNGYRIICSFAMFLVWFLITIFTYTYLKWALPKINSCHYQ